MRYEQTLSDKSITLSGAALAATQVAGLAAALAVGALIKAPLPFTPVPITLQTLPVLLAAFAMGPTRAMMGVLLYIGLGLAGAPWFAASLSATFGYLIAFAAVPWVVSAIPHRAMALAAGQATIYVLGAAWLAWWTQVSFTAAVAMGVLPFVAGDLLKGVAAYILAGRLSNDATAAQ